MQSKKNYPYSIHPYYYFHLSNSQGGWNKRGGGADVVKSINEEEGINVKVVFFFLISINEQGEFLRGGWIFFSKLISESPRLLER